jgi:energy-converting hydrogenase A subunit M
MARRTPPPVVKAEPGNIIDGALVDGTTGGPDDGTTGEALDGEVQDEAPKDEELHHGFVEFQGRTIEVQPPELEQIVIIRRLQKVFSDASALRNIDVEEALDLMDMALKAATSVTVHPQDVRFIEALWLDRKIKVHQTLPLLSESMKALEAANADRVNRSTRRARQRKSSPKTGKATLVTG